MTPASGASMTRHCISRTGTPSKSGPSASGDTSSTAGQPRDQELWARKAGWRATSDSPHILSARWHSFHGNLLRYQRQLEGALEIHTLSCELDAVTEQVREKVSGQQMWPGGDSCPQVLPCARLSSPAGALRWSPGTLSPGSALQKPRCRPGGQPPGPFCPLKPCECRGQTPGPGLPQLSLSESGPVGHRHQDCVSHGRATRAEHWQRWRRSCCGQPKKPRVRETVLSSLAPAPARPGCPCSAPPEEWGSQDTVRVEAPHGWQPLPQGSPTPHISSELSPPQKEGAPTSPSEGPGRESRWVLAFCTECCGQRPPCSGEAAGQRPSPFLPFLPGGPGLGPGLREGPGECAEAAVEAGGAGAGSGPRPGPGGGVQLGVEAGPGHLLCGTQEGMRRARGLRDLESSQAHSAVAAAGASPARPSS